MKKVLALVIAMLPVSVTQVKAVVSVEAIGADLLDHNGNDATVGYGMGFLVLDIGGLGPPTGLISNNVSLAVGSVLLNNYQILGEDDFQDSGLLSAADFVVSVSLGGTLVPNKQLDLIWMPDQPNFATTTPASDTSWYGSYYGGSGLDGSDPWVVPADGGAVILEMLT
jgi:hypothetical protein